MKSILPLILLTPLAWAGGSSTIGISNPASENCVKLQGVLESVETPAGTYSNCAIEEWHLFNEMYVRGLVKEHTYPGPGASMPNPASVNCGDIGGATRIVEGPGGQSGICVVEEFKLLEAINVLGE